ncbi:MAG: hypothetical protein ACI9N9_000308 [Enterobacterales bacterium]|jgi:hypothetical protein
MSALNFGRNFENITPTTTGAATVAIVGEVMTCISVDGDNAKATKSIYLRQGDTIRVSAMARITSGTAPIGGIAISDGGDKARVLCESYDWERIEVSYSLPMTAASGAPINIVMGVFTSEAGTIEYSDPKIDIVNSSFGHNRVVAQGLLTLALGVAGINTGYTMNGILGVNYNAGTFELEVTIPRSTGASYSSPLIWVHNNDSGVTASRNIQARQRGYDAATGVTRVSFYDMAAHSIVDVATITSMFIFFKAEIN